MVLNIVFGLISLLGLVGTFYFGLEYRRLAQQRQRFSWSDVENGTRKIGDRYIRRGKPDALLTFSGAGSIIANMAMIHSNRYLPVYTAIEFPRGREPDVEMSRHFTWVKTSKWSIFVPNGIIDHRLDRVVIIHDSSISGMGLDTVIKKLVELGFARDRIKVAALVATQAAIDANLAPDFYAYAVDNSVFHFPWGQRI